MRELFVIDQETGNVAINIPYNTVYANGKLIDSSSDFRDGDVHKRIAASLSHLIDTEDYKTCMIIIESEHLADEHWDNPIHMHKTNNVIACEGIESARRELGYNHYFTQDELAKFIKDENLPTWRANFEDKEENRYLEKEKRDFKFEVEDAIFEYQVNCKMVEIIVKEYIDASKYKMDEYGYLIYRDDLDDADLVSEIARGTLFDEDGYALETDPNSIEKQKQLVLHRYLKPRVHTKHERVYHLPDPFNHWDGRSFWHQFFLVLDKKNNEILIHRGNTGSSGAREDNGKWAHTFAYLSKEYSKETPTYHFNYDKNNQLKMVAKYDEFKTLQYDLSGNYNSSHGVVDGLFKGKIIECASRFIGYSDMEEKEEEIEEKEEIEKE